ncbi:hypothetical protein V5O48_015505, partial [Marasmius crinis-equi]
TDDPHGVLQLLQLPLLETLMLSGSAGRKLHPPEFTSLLPIIHKFASVTRFSFYFGLNMAEQNPLIEIVKVLPNLTALDARIRGGEGNWGVEFFSSLASSPFFASQLSSLSLHEEDCDINISLATQLVCHLETRVARGTTKLTDVRLAFECDGVGSGGHELDRRLRDLEVRGTKVAIFSTCGRTAPWGRRSIVLGSASLATPSYVVSRGGFISDLE